jgi:hypothetical protein
MDSCLRWLVADFLDVVTLASDTEPDFERPYIARRSVAGNSLEVDGYTGEGKHLGIGLWRGIDMDHCYNLQLQVVRCTAAEKALERKSTVVGLRPGHIAGSENKAGEEVELDLPADSPEKKELFQGIADMVSSLVLEED